MFEAFRQGKNRFKSRFILRGRRKKFPNANPKAESSPNHFDFPVISYYFPPFSVSKLLGNVGRQIRAARLSTERERWNFSRSARFFAAAAKIFLSARQGFCCPLGALKIRAGGEAFFMGASRFIGEKNFPLRGAKKGRPAFGTAFRSFSVALSACAPRRRVRPISRGKPRIRRVREWRRRL